MTQMTYSMKKNTHNTYYRNTLYAIAVATFFFVAPHFVAYLSERDLPKEHLSACVSCEEKNAFTNLSLRAESTYVYDVSTNQVLFEKERDAQLPLASVTKVMTALLAYEGLPFDTKIVIQAEDLLPEGDSGLLVGESFTRNDLIDFMLSVSSNDAARAFARRISGDTERFALLMNKRAQELGMTQTFFFNESGLDENMGVSGGYGSARDMGVLFEYASLHYPELFEATTYPEVSVVSSDALHTATNTNVIAGDIPGLVASKTGYTDLAGGNLGIVFEPEPLHTIVVIVLGSTPEERFVDVEKLVLATIETLHSE